MYYAPHAFRAEIMALLQVILQKRLGETSNVRRHAVGKLAVSGILFSIHLCRKSMPRLLIALKPANGIKFRSQRLISNEGAQSLKGSIV